MPLTVLRLGLPTPGQLELQLRRRARSTGATTTPAATATTFVIHPQAQAVLAYREVKNNKTGKCLDFPGILPSAAKPRF